MEELHLYLYGVVDADSEASLSNFVQTYGKGGYQNVYVHINSPGGSVDEGFAIYDWLTSLDTTVTTIGEGQVYSIASVIFMAGNMRELAPNSQMMVHNPWGAFEGNREELEKVSEFLEKAEQKIANLYHSRAGVTKEFALELMAKETFLEPAKAVELGFATAIRAEKYKAVAYFDTNKLKINMELAEKDKSWLEKKFDSLSHLFKNEAPPAGNDVENKMDEDEDEEMKALKAEIENLKAALDKKDEEMQSLKAELEATAQAKEEAETGRNEAVMALTEINTKIFGNGDAPKKAEPKKNTENVDPAHFEIASQLGGFAKKVYAEKR